MPVLGEAYIGTLSQTLPDPVNHKIYFDYGTKTLDSLYEPYQLKVDQIMKNKGYIIGQNFISKKIDGASHNEESWRKRVHLPLEFLLNND